MIKKLFIVLVLLLAPALTHASALAIYVSQSGGVFSGGTACNGKTAISLATANLAASWGAGASQIGPGTTLYLCGTFTVSNQTVGLNIQNSGTSGNPLIVLADTGMIFQAPSFPGNPVSSSCLSVCGGIEAIGRNFVIIDGGTNGIVRNTLNGSTTKTCLGGACTQGASGSSGIFVSGNADIIRNWTINNVYISCGATNCTDAHAGEGNNAGINVKNGSTNIWICNNIITQVYGAIWTDTADASAPATVLPKCQANAAPTGGSNIFQNTLTDSCHHISPTGQGPVNVWMNDVSDWSDWIWPGTGNGCHTDGFISFSNGTTIMQPNVYDNYFHGDLGLGSPTAFIFCTYNGTNGGSSCTIFNNLLVGTGTTGAGSSALMWAHGGSLGPEFYYNNTTLLGQEALDMEGDAVIHFTFRNNIFIGNGNTSSTYAWHQESATQPWNTLTFTNANVFFNLRPFGPFNWNATVYTSLAAWITACKTGTGGGAGTCDDLSTTGNPVLNAAFIPQAGSSAIGLGANLTALGIAPLNFGAPSTFGKGSTFDGSQRTTSGAWTSGAYNVGTSPPAAIVVLSPNPLTFGNQNVLTTSSPLTVTVTNSGNLGTTLAPSGAVTLTGTNTSDFSITGGTCGVNVFIAPSGGTCTVTLTFTPTAGGARSAQLNISDDAPASPQATSITGTGVSSTATLLPNPFNFGNQLVSTTSGAQTLTFTNTGSVAITLATGSPVAISGTNASNFTTSGGTTCTSAAVVAPLATCVINITFTPMAVGLRTALVSITSTSSGSPQGSVIQGTGTQASLTITPSPTPFGNQQQGVVSLAQVVTVTNTGTASATLNAGTPVTITGTNPSDFTIITGTTCVANFVIPANSSCTINVTFTPGGLGARTATLNVADNAPSSPQSISLTGTGVVPTGPVGVGVVPSIVSMNLSPTSNTQVAAFMLDMTSLQTFWNINTICFAVNHQ